MDWFPYQFVPSHSAGVVRPLVIEIGESRPQTGFPLKQVGPVEVNSAPVVTPIKEDVGLVQPLETVTSQGQGHVRAGSDLEVRVDLDG